MSFDLIGAACIGDDDKGSSGGGGGFGFGNFMGPIADVLSTGIKAGTGIYRDKQAADKAEADKKQAAADDARKLDEARQALQSAAVALAKDASSPAAEALVQSAQRAVSSLSPAGQGEIGRWVDQQLAKAAKTAVGAAPPAKPTQPAAAPPKGSALVRAWTQLANMVHSSAIVASDKDKGGGEIVKYEGGGGGIGPFLQKPVVGPVKVWHVGAAGGAGLGLVLLKRLLRR